MLATVKKTYESVHKLIGMVQSSIKFSGLAENMTSSAISLVTQASIDLLIAKDNIETVEGLEANAILSAEFEELLDPKKMEERLTEARLDFPKIIMQSEKKFCAAFEKVKRVCETVGLKISVIE